MASRRRDVGRPLLVALCVAALFAVGSESHGLEDFGNGNTDTTPQMATFFGTKPEAAQLPEVLDTSVPAKPEATSAIPATTTASTTTASSAPPRRSVSVGAGVAFGVAAVAVVAVVEFRLGSP